MVFPTQSGTLTWELPRETTTRIKRGPFEESSLTAAVQDVLGPLLGSVAAAMNTLVTSGVSGPNQLREILRQHGKDMEKAVAEHTDTSPL